MIFRGRVICIPIAAGRDGANKFQHFWPTKPHILDLEVTNPPNAINGRIDEVLQVYGGVDVLVNNVGFI